MELHRLKSIDIEDFCNNKTEALQLLLVGLASFYSNSELFGGEYSNNYKIKKKHFENKGKQILKYLKNQ